MRVLKTIISVGMRLMRSELLAVVGPRLKPLLDLRALFVARGFDLWLVGGCVRDMMCGQTPKDFDLCTDADPVEQAAIYNAGAIRHHATGIKHGTWTIVVEQTAYEVTSLRLDTKHDGRHARVTYTRDLKLDLGRRDLTINAMALSLAGELFDPHGGESDLKKGLVRFVGEPRDRIKEDYLRILRWLRFHARFAGPEPRADLRLDDDTMFAVQAATIKEGLATISRERIWSEMARIVTGPSALDMLRAIENLMLREAIGLLEGYVRGNTALEQAIAGGCTAPTVMAAYVGSVTGVSALAARWKWSAAEREEALLVASYGTARLLTLDRAKIAVARDAVNKEWLRQTMLMQGDPVAAHGLATWPVPVFPVAGADLMAKGIEPGPAMGRVLRVLREYWADREFRPTRDMLLAAIDTERSYQTATELNGIP